MNERYIAALDLGSSRIKLAVAKVQGNDVQIIYYRDVNSDGVYLGEVRNPSKASEPVKAIIEEAEKELKIKILQTVVGLPRHYVREVNVTGNFSRSDAESCITQEEVDFLKESSVADDPAFGEDTKEMVYGAAAQSFSVDDYCNISEEDVIGMVSDKLEGNFKFFIGSKSARHKIDVVMNQAQVAISQLIFTPEAVGKAVLTKTQRENGVALLELGGGVSSVTIYKNDILCHYAAIPFGGNNITNDIKYECGVSTRLSENIKLAYGACQPDDLPSFGDKIIRINYEEDASEKTLPVSYLSEIITCREREIVEALLFEIQKSGIADSLRNGIVITGGGANMINCANLIKELSGYEVSFGFPRHLFSAEGCLAAKEMDAVTVVAMILKAKTDPMLNCLDKVPSRTAAEGTAGQEVEENTGDDPVELFPESDPVEEKKVKAKKERRPEPKKREPKIKWTFIDRVKEETGKLFGDLYDGMMDNENETEV